MLQPGEVVVAKLLPTIRARLAQELLRTFDMKQVEVAKVLGITPVEAMAAGKCVLATDEGGYRETVLHGRTGFLLPPNPEAFVQRIQVLDESTLRGMKDACVARAREFDETRFVERMKAALAS